MSAEQVHGVILSGGGAYAAYQVGVMRALCEGKSPSTCGAQVAPEVFTGTSAGAFNAAVLVSERQSSYPEALNKLQSIWLDQIASRSGQPHNGVFRMRLNPVEWMNPLNFLREPGKMADHLRSDGGFLFQESYRRMANFWRSSDGLLRRTAELFDLASFIDTRPFDDLVKRTVDGEAIAASANRLRVPVTNWKNGEVVIFDNASMRRHAPGVVLASGALPGFFPPVTIGDGLYVDGGVVMNTPLMPAIRARANVAHAIYMDPDLKAMQLDEVPSTISNLDRLMLTASANMVNKDIETARMINAALLQFDPRGRPQADVDAFMRLLEAMTGGTPSPDKPPKQFKLITIHRYRPQRNLGGMSGVLNFDLWHLEKLIGTGYEDAKNHDCADSGCVVVPPERMH